MSHQYISDTTATGSSLAFAGNNYGNVTYIKIDAHRPQAPLKPSQYIPVRRDVDFIDRDDLLSQISARCSRHSGCAALVGLGGVGKSQLAIEYAWRVKERSPETWVFWAHADTQAHFEKDYRRIASALRLPGRDEAKSDIMELVYSWLCDESNGRWMLVVDNADDPGVFYPKLAATPSDSARQLSDFLPQSAHGSILITSRNEDAAFRLVGHHNDILRVGPMGIEDSLALLHKKLSRDVDQEEAKALVDALDRVPLAISQAAAYIRRAPYATASTYLRGLCAGDQDRAELLDTDVGDTRRDSSASNSVIRTWHMSFEYIRNVRPSATQLLSLMSLFDRQGISRSLLAGRYGADNSSSVGFEEDLSVLLSFSLVSTAGSTDTGTGQLQMHQLVQFSTKRWLALKQEIQIWKRKFLSLMDESFPSDLPENWTSCQSLLPHALAALEYPPSDKDQLELWASMLSRASSYANSIGSFATAARVDDVAVKILSASLGAEHPVTMSSIARMSSTFANQGLYNKTEELDRQILESCRRVWGEDHLDTITATANLASTLWYRGRYDEAEELESQVIEIYSKRLGRDHPDTLSCMANLASTYELQGRDEEAHLLHRQVAESRKRVLGGMHPDTLDSIANLASTLESLGQHQEAEELTMQVIKCRKEIQGEEHPETIASMANRASVLRSLQRFKEASELGLQAMEMSKRVLGDEHPDTLTLIGSLALTLNEYGETASAMELMETCREAQMRALGPDHPFTILSADTLCRWRTDLSNLLTERE